MHRRIEIPIVTHHQRIVAAHFQGQNFLRLRGELAVQMGACLRTAGEKQAIDARVSGKRNCRVAPALQQI